MAIKATVKEVTANTISSIHTTLDIFPCPPSSVDQSKFITHHAELVTASLLPDIDMPVGDIAVDFRQSFLEELPRVSGDVGGVAAGFAGLPRLTIGDKPVVLE